MLACRLIFLFFYWRIGTLPCIIATVNTLCSWRKLESHCLVITACVCMFANTLIEDMAPTIICRSPSSAVAEFKCGEVRVAPGRLMKLNHTYTSTLKTFKKRKSKLFQYTHTQSLIAQAFIKWFDENVNYTGLSLSQHHHNQENLQHLCQRALKLLCQHAAYQTLCVFPLMCFGVAVVVAYSSRSKWF